MNYVLKPLTLQNMTLVKIVIKMWMLDEIMALMPPDKARCIIFRDNMEVLIKLREKIKNFPLPKTLKNKLLVFIKPIGVQIYQWYSYHGEKYSVIIERKPKTLYWTPYGTIDKVNSIQVLVRDQSMKLKVRYNMACDYCLVDEIYWLWKQMSKEEKLRLIEWCDSFPLGRDDDFPVFWTYHLIGKPIEMHNYVTRKDKGKNLSTYYYGCYRAMLNNNPTATKYFFQKLSSEEKDILFKEIEYLLFIFYDNLRFNGDPREYFVEIACFLLCRMSENQRLKIVNNCFIMVLRCLLVWPYQSLFFETLYLKLEVPKENYLCLILDGLSKEMQFYGCIYRDIAREVWRLSPDKCKRYVFQNPDSAWIWLHLFYEIGEVELCKLMLNDASPEEKNGFIGHERSIMSHNVELVKMKWKAVTFFVEECRPSKETIKKLKKSMMCYVLETNDEGTIQFFQSLWS